VKSFLGNFIDVWRFFLVTLLETLSFVPFKERKIQKNKERKRKRNVCQRQIGKAKLIFAKQNAIYKSSYNSIAHGHLNSI